MQINRISLNNFICNRLNVIHMLFELKEKCCIIRMSSNSSFKSQKMEREILHMLENIFLSFITLNQFAPKIKFLKHILLRQNIF